MKKLSLIAGIVCSLGTLGITSTAHACYYEGDPVKTASGFDTPKTASDIDCYYDGDPVANASGQYDSLVISYESGEYYTADMPEKYVSHDSTQKAVNISASENGLLNTVMANRKSVR